MHYNFTPATISHQQGKVKNQGMMEVLGTLLKESQYRDATTVARNLPRFVIQRESHTTGYCPSPSIIPHHLAS